MLIKEGQSENEREGREWTRGVSGESGSWVLIEYLDFDLGVIYF